MIDASKCFTGGKQFSRKADNRRDIRIMTDRPSRRPDAWKHQMRNSMHRHASRTTSQDTATQPRRSLRAKKNPSSITGILRAIRIVLRAARNQDRRSPDHSGAEPATSSFSQAQGHRLSIKLIYTNKTYYLLIILYNQRDPLDPEGGEAIT